MENRLRIIFKDDRDSSIGRGAYMLAEHFESPVVELLAATAREVERLLPEATVLRITEGWRPSIHPHGRDLHSTLKALDFTIEFPAGPGRTRRATPDEYGRVAESVRQRVGDRDYDFQVHGDGLGLHIHEEFDPKPERATV